MVRESQLQLEGDLYREGMQMGMSPVATSKPKVSPRRHQQAACMTREDYGVGGSH